jgi:cyclophilin family peptidyl-prolyl cis-trans isomerase
MPHTVWTFLNLVDKGLYVDTTIDFQKDKVIRGGGLDSVEPQKGKNLKSAVMRRFANFGYSVHNTLFFDQESSPNTPCRHSSFALHERGPGFVVYLTNDISSSSREGKSNPNNCPGVIVKGRDTLERILHAHTNAQEGGELTWKVPVVATYLVSVGEVGIARNDEL